MEFAEVVKAYAEVGVLGLCAVLMIILFYKSYTRHEKNDDKNSKKVDEKDTLIENQLVTLMNNTLEQQQRLFENQLEQNRLMMEGFVDQITTHTPSKEENEKQLKISREVDFILQDMLDECKASRVSLVQYHNGGHGLNKHSFLKMSMTNERMQVGIHPLITEFKDQFRSVLSYFVHEIDENGFCMIEDVETIKELDAGTYEFLKGRNVQAKFGMGIKDHQGMTLGFVCIEYRFKDQANLEAVRNTFKTKQKALEVLLCTK